MRKPRVDPLVSPPLSGTSLTLLGASKPPTATGSGRGGRRGYSLSTATGTTAPWVLAVGGCLAIALLLWWPIPWYPMVYSSSESSITDDALERELPAFTLLVSLTFDSLESKRRFTTELFPPMAAYVQTHEPKTLAYQLLESDQNDTRVMILERYRDKQQDYLGTHKLSAMFQTFRAQLSQMEEAGRVVVSGQSYVDGGDGYIRS